MWQVLASILLVQTNTPYYIILLGMCLIIDRNYKFGFGYHLNSILEKPSSKILLTKSILYSLIKESAGF